MKSVKLPNIIPTSTKAPGQAVAKISPCQNDAMLNLKIEQETARATAKENELEAAISQAGKIDDVKVDGTSVVTNKVANISLQPIRDDITSEAAARTAADALLSSAIAAESSRAQTAESTLESKTDAASKLTEAKGYTDNKVSIEANARSSADSTLQDEIDNLKARGRFLSLWNSVAGLPTTEPLELPYTYKSGDYYIIDVVGTTNYQPSGTSYTGAASTVAETREISQDDVYYFDGTSWSLQINSQKAVRFASILGQPSDNANLASALNAKQNTLSSSQMDAVNSGITSSILGNLVTVNTTQYITASKTFTGANYIYFAPNTTSYPYSKSQFAGISSKAKEGIAFIGAYSTNAAGTGSVGTSVQLRIDTESQTRAFEPGTTNSVDLGSSSKLYKNAYIVGNLTDGVNNITVSSIVAKQDALGYTPENISNKVTSISSSSTHTQYASAKCVYDIVGNIEATLDAIRGA